MAIKLEFLLVFLTVAVLTMAVTVDLHTKHNTKKLQTVEMEFTDTTTREVDENVSLSVSYGTYGIRDNGILTVDNLRYHSAGIELLQAKKGKYIGDDIYLDYNVSVHKELGSDYYAEHAVYNTKTGILNVTSPFVAVINKNVMRGDSLRFDSVKNEVFATEVDAVIFTSEK